MKPYYLHKVTFIKAMSILILLVFSFIMILSQKPAFAINASSPVTVTAYALNVRESPDIASHILSVVHRGETFHVIQSKNGWHQIRLSNGKAGWVNAAYIKAAKSNTKIEASVNAPVLNVRERPGLTSKITSKLTSGSKVTILSEQAGWAEIISVSGIQGWVYEYYITKNKTAGKSKAAQEKQEVQHVSKKVSQTVSSPQTGGKPLAGKTIILDPGHGGKDNGTTSVDGTHEKTLTLETAKKVQQKLESAGAHVVMTRSSDTYISLMHRADVSNQNNADAFISFHYNSSSDPSAHGLIDFYYQSKSDYQLASDILNEVVKTTKLTNGGTRFDNLSVLRNNAQPSTLIELGFLSNKQETSVVESADYREKAAQGVYAGLIRYFQEEK